MSLIYLDFFAAIIYLISVILTIKQKNSLWPVSIIAIIIYAFIYYQQGYYSNVILNIFYFIQCIIGWIYWKAKKELPVIRGSFIELNIVIFSIIFGSTYLYELLSLSYLDLTTGLLSLYAMYLLIQRKLTNWYCWAMVDCWYIFVFFKLDMTFSFLLYIILLILTRIGYKEWKKGLKLV